LLVILASIGDIQFSITRLDLICPDRDDYSMPILAKAFISYRQKFPDRCYLQSTWLYFSGSSERYANARKKLKYVYPNPALVRI